MKKIIITVILLISCYLQAQVTKNLGDFDAVKVFDRLNVKLIPSDESKITITGNRAEEVEIINKNGELKIRMPFPKLLKGNDIKIDLYFKKIESIDATEGSNIVCDIPFDQTALSVNAKEAAKIKVIFGTQKATIRAVSGGILNLKGKTENQEITLGSGGVLKAKDLISVQTTITVSAGGEAEIYATTLVDASVKAGGTIYIYGKPKQLNQKTILGGKIIQK